MTEDHAIPVPGGAEADTAVLLRAELGGRSLGHVKRMLRLVRYSLDDVLADRTKRLPPPGRDGWFIRSLPVDRLAEARAGLDGWLVAVRQTYRRHYLPMAGLDFDGWWQGFSARSRSTLGRKERRLQKAAQGALSVRAYRTPAEVAQFMEIAGQLSERTYQARLLQAGLPTGPAAVERAVALAWTDDIRCFLLFLDEKPVAYLYLPVERDVVIYGFLGYDPDYAALSPGTVLHLEAMRRLFAEGRFRQFDFTEGDGAHKAQFGRGHVDCADLIVLRPHWRNRAALGTIAAIDRVAALGKAVLERTNLRASVSALLRR